MSNNNEDLNLLRTFCKVAELGSFSKAAADLKQPKSRVSRAISRLEANLKTSLIRRTTRSFSLTDQGQQFFDRLNPLLTDLNTEIRRLDAQSDEISGIIRLTSPDDVSMYLLEDIIREFSKLYPKVNFHIDLSNKTKDLTSDNMDLAFRIGKLKDSSAIQSFLLNINLVVVASNSYFDKNPIPLKREDVLKHNMLLLKRDNTPMELKGLKATPSKLSTCTNFPMLYQMVKSGAGIGVIPDFYCNADIENGQVKQLFPDWKILKTKLHLIYPSRHNLPKRVRLFINFAKEKLQTS